MADNFWSMASIDVPADLRTEFNRLIDGHGSFDGIGVFMVLRSMTDVFCDCYDPAQGSGTNCKFCLGESYKWTESYVHGYFTQTFGRSITGIREEFILRGPGYFDHGKALIYLKFDANPKAGDAIFRIRLNTEGAIYYPIDRIEKWKITAVEDKRYDRGRIAYFICLCEREEV